MPDPYTLNNTAAQIDAAIQAAVDSDQAPAASSTKLVNSNRIYNFVTGRIASAVALLSPLPNIVQSVKTNIYRQSNPNNVWGDIPGLSVTLTPNATGSNVFISMNVCSTTNDGNYGVRFRLTKNGIPLVVGDASGNRIQATFMGGYSGQFTCPSNAFEYLDTTITTAATPIVYTLQATCQGGVDVLINRVSNDIDNATYSSRSVSVITAKEIYK